MGGTPKRVREQVVVYLEPRDREMLEKIAAETGLSRTEILRRGLWMMASGSLVAEQPGSSLTYLVETAVDADFPPDLSARPDHYLYRGGYSTHRPTRVAEGSTAKQPKPRRARPR
jgi:hypothetical protein